MRVATSSPYDAYSEPLIKERGWLIVKLLIDRETVKIVYKALHNEVPESVNESFHRLSDVQNRELRNSITDLHITLSRTSSGQKSVACRGVCIWNNLSNEPKASISSSAFKAKLKA